MQDSLSSESPATTETTETLRQRVEALEAEIAAMRPILFKVAEARMCRDMATMIESCPFCTLKRGGEHGYSGKHDAKCLVTQARLLGF